DAPGERSSGTGWCPRPGGSCDNTSDATLLSDPVSARWLMVPGRRRAPRSLPMADDANQCPICGAVRAANAPEGLCPRCALRQAMTDAAPGPANVDDTTVPASTGSGHLPEPTPIDPEATGAHIAGTVVDATSPRTDEAGDWTIDPGDPTRTADDRG